MKDWVHPAVRRGSSWVTAQAVFIAGFAVFLVVLALWNPTRERLLWAAGGVLAAVLVGFLARWQIKKLRYDYRYEDDEDAADRKTTGTEADANG